MSKKNNHQDKKDNQVKKELYAKLGITDEIIENDEKIITETKKIDSDKYEKDLTKQEIDNEIGWKKPKELLLNFIYGVFMAFSDAIPGYSGGTTLSILGFYEKLISSAKNVFKPEIKGTWWKYLLWLFPFIIAWIGFLILILFLVDKISEANKGIVLVFLFGSFAFCSIPFFYLVNKNKLPSYITKFKNFNNVKEKRSNLINLGLIIFGFLLLIVFAIVIRCAFDGVSFIKDDEKHIFNNKESFDMGQVFIVLGSGFLVGFFMFVPGISGSLMLYLCNVYSKVSGNISELLNGSKDGVDGIPYLVMLALGGVLGIITSIILINWFIKKWEMQFYSFSFGLLLASFISIFISVASADYKTLSDGTTLGLSIAMIPIALIFNIGLFIFLNQTKKISFPKFYIKTKKDKIVN